MGLSERAELVENLRLRFVRAIGSLIHPFHPAHPVILSSLEGLLGKLELRHHRNAPYPCARRWSNNNRAVACSGRVDGVQRNNWRCAHGSASGIALSDKDRM